MDEIRRGMPVTGQDGQLGTVEDIVTDPNNGAPRLLVRRDDGQSIMLESGTYMVEGTTVRLIGTGYETRAIGGDFARASGTSDRLGLDDQTFDVPDGEQIVIPVVREDVRVGRRVVEGGGVRVHKRVEEHEEVLEQPVFREDVSVERVTIGRPVDEATGSRQEGDTLVIPVYEEMLVVEKRLVLKEELRIMKRRTEEVEKINVLVREEHVDIEQLDGPRSNTTGTSRSDERGTAPGTMA